MKWYAVKKEYIDYLKKWDKKIPNVDYGNRMKCFIGVIFIKNDIEYFAPLTSFKEKFISMKNDIDFYKITNYETGKIYGPIDINNMIPNAIGIDKDSFPNNPADCCPNITAKAAIVAGKNNTDCIHPVKKPSFLP